MLLNKTGVLPYESTPQLVNKPHSVFMWYEIFTNPIAFQSAPDINRRFEILHWFGVSSPLFQRGLAGAGQSPAAVRAGQVWTSLSKNLLF